MLDRKRYASYANNTKWSKLREAMLGLYPKAPSFRIKALNWIGEARWDGEWYYHFRSDCDWKDMEWVDLKPQPSTSAVSLDEIESICRRIGFEVERQEDIVRAIGYRKIS
jgi:hypothetical protein